MQTERFWLGIAACAAAVVCVSLVSATAQGAILSIDFDGAGYVAGQQPPLPWRDDSPNHTIEAGMGYLGTQCLVLRANPVSAVYDLPTPLTSDIGAVTIEILFHPGGYPYNYGRSGGISLMGASSSARGGVTFYHHNGISGIYSYPGTGHVLGTRMGPFSALQWYQITIDIDEDWQNMTFNVGPVGETPLSQTTSFNGGAIDRFHLSGNQDPSRVAIYDNLSVTTGGGTTYLPGDANQDGVVNTDDLGILLANWGQSGTWTSGDFNEDGVVNTDDLGLLLGNWGQSSVVPEPATLALLGLGGLGLIRRRR